MRGDEPKFAVGGTAHAQRVAHDVAGIGGVVPHGCALGGATVRDHPTRAGGRPVHATDRQVRKNLADLSTMVGWRQKRRRATGPSRPDCGRGHRRWARLRAQARAHAHTGSDQAEQSGAGSVGAGAAPADTPPFPPDRGSSVGGAPAPTATSGPFRVLVTGSRTWTRAAAVVAALHGLHAEHGAALVVVHGACPRGADAIAEAWCRRRGVPVERYPADWPTGRGAGLARNAAMVATRPDLCLAFIHHRSPGATHCAQLAEAAGIPTIRHTDPPGSGRRPTGSGRTTGTTTDHTAADLRKRSPVAGSASSPRGPETAPGGPPGTQHAATLPTPGAADAADDKAGPSLEHRSAGRPGAAVRPARCGPVEAYLAAALDYAAAGLAVFLLGRTKRPVANCPGCRTGDPGHDPEACACLTCHGFYAATTDPTQVRAMFEAIPDGLLAMRTGAASGRLVVEIDPAHGGRVDPTLMVPTATVATGGGGWHLHYRHPGEPVLSRPLPGRRGVDIKADGGYVLAPPSTHPRTGRPYRWVGAHPLCEMPPALVQACQHGAPVPAPTATPRAPTTNGAGGISDADALLAAHLAAVAGAPEGRRRVTLYGAARGVARMVAAGALSAGVAWSVLTQAGRRAGQTDRDIRRAIEGGFRDEGVPL